MEGNKVMNRVIPDGEENCIWVEAGLVSYKLCDRNFECDECPFDQVMRQQARPASRPPLKDSGTSDELKAEKKTLPAQEVLSNLVDGFFAAPQSAPLPADRVYSRSHVWMMRQDDQTCRLGLDHYAAFLLGNVNGVILSPQDAVQAVNNPLAWMICEEGTLAVRSPIPGKVVRANSLLKDSACLIKDDPYGKGWISDLEMTVESGAGRKFQDHGQAELEYRVQFDQLKKDIVGTFERVSTSGVTLMDGGTRPRNLRDLLGPQELISLVQKLLSLKS